MKNTKLIRGIYVSLGFFFTGLGGIGVVLPILPTTPFLLLALACFSRGSEKFSNWFKSTKLYKNNIEDFVSHRSMTLRNKIMILAFASTMLLFPLIFVDYLWVKIVVICLYITKYYYFIFRIKTISPEEAINQKLSH